MARPAVFLDKDGTLVRDVPYNVDPALVQLMPGVTSALARLRDAGYLLVLVSNQSGIARGRFDELELRAALDRLAALLAADGVVLDDVIWCPHHPAGSVREHAVSCACRKPRPGMLLAAADRHDVDLARSWMVGDILDDVEAGGRAGCRTVLVDTGGEDEWRDGPWRRPDVIVPDMAAAAEAILGDGAVSTSVSVGQHEGSAPWHAV